MKRRDFLKLTGCGLSVFFTIPRSLQAQASTTRQGYPADLNAYVHIGEDGRVTCLVGKIEMGQGNMTALAQLLADELDVPMESIDMVMGDTDRSPWDMGTFGSMSIRVFGPVLRGAAAAARAELLAMAAERLQVPAAQLRVANAAVSDSAHPEKRVTYAALVKGKRIERRLEGQPALKPPSAFTIVGTSVPRLDAHDKVTGAAKYAGDIRLPGMLQACLVRPPAHGAVLRAVDTRKAEAIDGVRVVRDGDLVAVLHEHRDVAERARDLVVADYERKAPPLDDRTIFDHLVKAAPAGRTVDQAGSLDEGRSASAQTFDSTYLSGYVAHAPIETHSATARLEGGRITIWVSTQAPFLVKPAVARAMAVEPDAVHIITPYVGGGFGGKTNAPQAVEAARIAKLAGAPVQVVWSREEEFFYDTFRPATVIKAASGIGPDGKITFWDFTIYAGGEREAKLDYYTIPHRRIVTHGSWGGDQGDYHPFGVGAWRAPGVPVTVFARESQIDVMAAAAKMDPVEFRRANLGDRRMGRVLDAAAKAFGWTPKAAPGGRGVGVAVGMDSGTYVAMMVEVAVDRATGRVAVQRIVTAQEMGVIVNPDGASQQMEGCVTMGLGYVLSEEVRFKDGEILDTNFDTYDLPRYSWLPRIQSVLIPDPERPAQGGGEPAIVTLGAAVANAIFDATGARLFHMPFTPERVKAAIGARPTEAR